MAVSASRVTIRDVAKRAGVSVCTVSRVLSNKGAFTEATQQRVMSVAAELHFTPNGLIRSLQRGETRTVGVAAWGLGSDPLHEIALPTLRAIVEGLAERGRDTLLYADFFLPRQESLVSSFLDKRADAVIWGPAGAPVSELERLASSGLPAVIVYYDPVPEGLACVNIDNAGGAAAAIEYLAGLGHRRIAVESRLGHPSFRARAAGSREAFEHLGLEFDPSLFLAPEQDWMPINQAADRLFSAPEPPTALFVACDRRAFVWLEEFARRGLRVPEDISLIGFDGVPAALMDSALTTVRQPFEEVGRTAARYIDKLLSGTPPSECRTVLPVKVAPGKTTAPCSP